MMDARILQRIKKTNTGADKQGRMRHRIAATIVMVMLLSVSLVAQDAPQLPRVVGIAHVALYVSDLGKERAFYKDFLGFDEPFSLRRDDGKEWISFIKLNDYQYLELFTGDPRFGGLLNHFAFYTNDVVAMKAFLISRKVNLVDDIHIGRTGDKFFSIRDPDGHLIEIVQYQPNGWNAQNRGQFVPTVRISDHLNHIALPVSSMVAAIGFYGDILGLRHVAQDMKSGPTPAWINMAVPGGTDYVQLVFDPEKPRLERLKAQTHIGLATADVAKCVADLRSRTRGPQYTRALEVEVAKEGNRATSLFDPDGTGIELIEVRAASGNNSAVPGPK